MCASRASTACVSMDDGPPHRPPLQSPYHPWTPQDVRPSPLNCQIPPTRAPKFICQATCIPLSAPDFICQAVCIQLPLSAKASGTQATQTVATSKVEAACQASWHAVAAKQAHSFSTAQQFMQSYVVSCSHARMQISWSLRDSLPCCTCNVVRTMGCGYVL